MKHLSIDNQNRAASEDASGVTMSCFASRTRMAAVALQCHSILHRGSGSRQDFRTSKRNSRRVPLQVLTFVERHCVFLAVVWAIVSTSCTAQQVNGEEFQVSLNGGSVITVDIAIESFAWTKVLNSGEMSKEQVAFADVEQLILSESPASEQVADVRRLLNMLSSPNYLDRKLAEEKLSKPEIGGTFKTMIKTQSNHESYEVRYRILRILDELDSDDSDSTTSEFDVLTLKDGTKSEGDAGDFRLQCTYRDRQMNFSRSDIRLISEPTQSNDVAAANPTVQVNMFHNHQGNFYLPAQINVDFEEAPNGAELKRNANVNDVFTSLGLRLGTEQEGYVGISGYGFKFSDKPATGNSICVFETIGTYAKRFKGVMELSFCMPNQKSVPAGVHEIGLLMARVNHSRDFIVEAYNADGEILASVESSDEPCVFAGIKSSEPIARVRILSNPYLFRIDRGIDEDFAVDSISFSPPVPIATDSGRNQPMVRLINGDLIKGDSIEITTKSSIAIDVPNNAPIDIGLDEVHSIFFGRETKISAKEKKWTAMLPDRSTIFVEPGKSFSSTTFSQLTFKPSELMGLWTSQNSARFPESNDFNNGKTVMVFPTCRIASDSVEFTDLGFNWPETAKKLIQPLKIEGDERDDEDPTPNITSVEYQKTWSESIPTIWMNPPKSQTPGTGRLRLTDGEQLVLGANSSFDLVSLDKDKIVVAIGGRETEISMQKVVSIEFPKNQ